MRAVNLEVARVVIADIVTDLVGKVQYNANHDTWEYVDGLGVWEEDKAGRRIQQAILFASCDYGKELDRLGLESGSMIGEFTAVALRIAVDMCGDAVGRQIITEGLKQLLVTHPCDVVH